MAKDVFYRRSFHSDRDLKGVDSILECDQTFSTRRSNVNRRVHASDAGLEAPRNSLDVATAGLLDMRRRAPMEIPMGYELSRSLTSTTGRRTDYEMGSHYKAKQMETGQKARTSVVARLMGLDPLPPQQEDTEFSRHRSSRMPTQDPPVSHNNPSSIAKQPHSKFLNRSVEPLSSYDDTPSGYGELPFRKHPQEKQLEEFKKEFHARQSLQRRSPVSVRAKLAERERERFFAAGGASMVQDSEEFLDALDFLQTNREFFARVLNDPASVMFAKQQQQQQRSDLQQATNNRDGQQVKQKGGANLTRSVSEYRKDYISSYESVGARKNEADGRYDTTSSRLSTDHPIRHSSSTAIDQQAVPTRIVVLKPNTGKYPSFKKPYDTTPLSPSSYFDLNARITKVKDGKENLKHSSRDRMVPIRSSSSSSREIGSSITYYTDVRHDAKDIPYRDVRHDAKDIAYAGVRHDGEDTAYADVGHDAKDIARRIVKHMKEDMSRRLLEEATQTSATMAPPPVKLGGGIGRQLLSQRGGLYRDTSGISDNEGYFGSSRKISRDNNKLYSSLPSSPSLARCQMYDEEQHYFGSASSRKGVNRAGVSGKISRESTTSRGDVYAHHFADSASALDGNGQHHDSIIKVSNRKDDGPKVLPRSLSAPAAPTRDGRIPESVEKSASTAMEPVIFSRRSKPSESSLFKGRFMSLKDNILSGKRRSSKKQEYCTSSGSLDVAENADSVLEQGKYNPQSDAASLSQDDEHKESLNSCLIDSLSSDNSMTPKALMQRGSTTAVDLMDNTSEASVDNCEQPSPVSVLDITYTEGSPNSDVREMHLKHCDLKMEHLPDQKEYMHRATDGHSTRICAEEPLSGRDLTDLDCQLPNTIWSISCPPERHEELIYIRDILVFAGFTRDGNVLKHAFSMQHGLDPALFARLEDSYKRPLRRTVLREVESSIDSKARRLLFDVVDEILSVQLKKPTSDPWLTPAQVNATAQYTGKKLLERIWSQLSYHGIMPCESEETVGDIVAKDLTKENPWVHGQADIQSAATELERLVCGDLIREFVHEYLKR